MITDDRIRAEQVRSIYRNTPPGLIATFIAVAALTGLFVYLDVAEEQKALLFIGFMLLQTVSRLLLYRAFVRAAPAPEQWRTWAYRFTVGTIIGGLTIGGGAIYVMSQASAELQLVCLLLIFACVSGAHSAFAAYLPAFYWFLACVSVAPVSWLATQGTAVHTTLAALYLLWATAIVEQARRSSFALAESVRLRFQNDDLVERLRIEKAAAERANTAKSRFLAAASHDLRQPVHALSLFVAALRPHTMDEEARGLLDHVDNSVRAMGGLFGGLLDISRLDAGVVEVTRTPFAIQPLLERVCRDYEVQAQAKGVRLQLQPSSATIESDPMLLERVLRNVIANAVTYTERGRIVVGCRRSRPLSIQVWDTGRGIAVHEQEQIFQEFYQIGNPERDRTKGVGLGLAIVRRLTTLLGHTLTVRSVPGKGTVFKIGVPWAEREAIVPEATGEIAAPLLSRGEGLVLVIDDELAIQVAMKSLLDSWGYETITAGSCEEMLAQIAAHPTVPRLIISDYRLRENESGIAAIERLRSEYNDEIPGMLITGDTAPDRLKEAQESGFVLLHKPVQNSRLRASIAHLVNA